MTRPLELIDELCPDGVEYKKLGECLIPTQNIKWKQVSNNLKYSYIDLTSVNRDTHKIEETATISSDSAPSRAQQIIKKDDVIFATTRPTLMRYCIIDDNYNDSICSTGFCVLRSNTNLVLPKWIYHNVSSKGFEFYVESHQQGASYPSIADKELKKYLIPVPPLEIQREIVRILDKFTELKTKLNAELAAEQKVREQQYEYYLNKVFESEKNVQWKSMGDLFPQIRNGFVGTIKPYFTDKEHGVRYLEGTNIHDGTISDNEVLYVTKEFHQKHINAYHILKLIILK